MSQRAIVSLKPFPFDPAFQAPAPAPDDGRATAPERVTMTPAELAELGATLQASAAAGVQARLDAAALARLELVAERLGRATETLATLADVLDRTGEAALEAVPAAGLARRIAQEIGDGQGDLFAALGMLAPEDRP